MALPLPLPLQLPLQWAGRLWSVAVPSEITDNRAQWIWAQMFVATAGSEKQAWEAVLRHQFPGIGWSASSPAPFKPLPYSFAFPGPGPWLYKSSPSSPYCSRSHAASRTKPSPSGSGAASGSGGPRRPPLPRATSSASSHSAHRKPVALPGSKPRATPRTEGWLGSTSTRPPTSVPARPS